MTITEYATVPPPATMCPAVIRPRKPLLPKGFRRPRTIISLAAMVGLMVPVGEAGLSGELGFDAVVTLIAFLIAVWAWIFAEVDDTYVALGAAIALVLVGVVDVESFTGTLGDGIIWLLVGAFVIASAATASGLSHRCATRIVAVARTPRQLVHLITAALIVTTFAVPSTSGRAALALPIFLVLASALAHRRRLVLCLSLVFPSVILFSAIGSLLGAGAHLITAEIVSATTDTDVGFVDWLILGLPLAVVWSHLAAEVALLLTTSRTERSRPLRLAPEEIDVHHSAGRGLDTTQRRVAIVLAVVVMLWSTEAIHGMDPSIVAIVGALAATAPVVGAITLPAAVKTIPWTLLLFMAATLALALALSRSGAAQWLADKVFGPISGLGSQAAPAFIVAVVLVSLAAHLVMQSRSARSAVLGPIVVVTAPMVGVDPAAAAFLSTAAAGFCITLTSSAKPVAMFAASDDVPGYRAPDLLRLAAVLAPLSLLLIVLFALFLWPHLSLTLQPS